MGFGVMELLILLAIPVVLVVVGAIFFVAMRSGKK